MLYLSRYLYISDINRSIQQNIMSTKLQSAEDRASLKGISKKIRCADHRLKYVFKCEYPNCQSPFICSSLQCIGVHEHEGKITMSKFSTQSISNKFYEVDCLITDDTIYQNAKVLKNYIDGLKDTIKNIYVGIKSINQNYDFLKGDIEGPLNVQYIQKVQQNYVLNQTVRKNLDELKDKIKLEFPVKDSYFTLRSYLIEFLSQNIPTFNWSKSKQLHSSKNDPITCQKFHQKLSGIQDLIFVFVGDTQVIGSYYACEYPSLAEKSKKDPKSFFFISRKDQTHQFLKFQASDSAEHHIQISQKNYICQGNTSSFGDGIRTFHKNFQNIDYCLPSNTYKCTQPQEDILNGTLRVKRFMILKAYKQKSHSNGESHTQHLQINGNTHDTIL